MPTALILLPPLHIDPGPIATLDLAKDNGVRQRLAGIHGMRDVEWNAPLDQSAGLAEGGVSGEFFAADTASPLPSSLLPFRAM
jgi:hypothetical protein